MKKSKAKNCRIICNNKLVVIWNLSGIDSFRRSGIVVYSSTALDSLNTVYWSWIIKCMTRVFSEKQQRSAWIHFMCWLHVPQLLQQNRHYHSAKDLSNHRKSYFLHEASESVCGDEMCVWGWVSKGFSFNRNQFCCGYWNIALAKFSAQRDVI